MNKNKFLDFLDSEEISFSERGGRIIVDHSDIFDLDINSIPPGIIFRNEGDVYLDLITNLPKDTEFENGGHVFIPEVVSISKGVKFRNKGDVNMESLKEINNEIIFKNSGDLKFDVLDMISVKTIFQNAKSIFFLSEQLPSLNKNVRFENGKDIVMFEGNIKNVFIDGIRKQNILNCMIKQILGKNGQK